MMAGLGLEFKAPTSEAAQRIGIIIIQAIQGELGGFRSGRWYPLPGNLAYEKTTPKEQRALNYWVKYTGTYSRNEILGAAYRASAPGEPPASRTGRLRQSFHIVIAMINEATYRVSVRTNIHYADDLEFGTERVEARPFVVPALEKAMPKIVAIQHEFLYKLVRGQVSSFT
jgi:hypothetical protein